MNIIKQISSAKVKTKNWLYDHMWVKNGLDWFWIFLVSTVSALCFAFGFNVFLDPGISVSGTAITKIVSGGVSGISQTLVLFFRLCGWDIQDEHLAYSIMYFVINIPLILLAWFGIGKRFSIFTLINVGEVSLFIKLLSAQYIPGMATIATFVVTQGGGLLARALFAGVMTGLSSALAYRVDISAGGIDVLAYYIALKKNTLVGKYSVILNSVTLACFTLLTCVLANWDSEKTADAFSLVFYTIIYMFVAMLVVDNINVRNKKVKVEIITNRKDLGSVLIDTIPHGATLVQGEGVFTGQAKYIITIVVSYYEVDEVVKLVRKEDEHAFVQVIPLRQVYGRFFMKPVK
jgi:uncharacterized membrane-anchored protein YitT (DUF2179 family)